MVTSSFVCLLIHATSRRKQSTSEQADMVPTTSILSCARVPIHVLGRHVEQLSLYVSIRWHLVLLWSYCEIYHENPLLLVYPFLLSNCQDSLSFFNYTQANKTFFYSRLLYISTKLGILLLNQPIYIYTHTHFVWIYFLHISAILQTWVGFYEHSNEPAVSPSSLTPLIIKLSFD
jgi:hypothetical protein